MSPRSIASPRRLQTSLFEAMIPCGPGLVKQPSLGSLVETQELKRPAGLWGLFAFFAVVVCLFFSFYCCVSCNLTTLLFLFYFALKSQPRNPTSGQSQKDSLCLKKHNSGCMCCLPTAQHSTREEMLSNISCFKMTSGARHSFPKVYVNKSTCLKLLQWVLGC